VSPSPPAIGDANGATRPRSRIAGGAAATAPSQAAFGEARRPFRPCIRYKSGLYQLPVTKKLNNINAVTKLHVSRMREYHAHAPVCACVYACVYACIHIYHSCNKTYTYTYLYTYFQILNAVTKPVTGL
jgi:hypothetical protein